MNSLESTNGKSDGQAAATEEGRLALIGAASVLDAFDLFFWQPDLTALEVEGGRLQGDGSAARLDWLMPLCEQILQGPLTGKWRMNFARRRAHLRRLGTRQRMRQALRVTKERPGTDVQRVFDRLVGEIKEPLVPEDMSRDELAALITVLSWTEGILDDLPDGDQVLAALDREDLLAPLKRLLRHGFENRESELNQLEQYLIESSADGPPSNWPAAGLDDPPFLFVFGSGGVGKSTLMARFILDVVVKEMKAPFAYIDIDRPVIRPGEPLTLLLEIITQLQQQLQFDDGARDLLVDKILEDLDRTEDKRVAESINISRGYFVHTTNLSEEIRRALKRSGGDIRRPVIVVDTFEEAQWFGESVVGKLLDLLFILNKNPEFDVIVSGRVLPDQYLQRAFNELVTTPAVDMELLNKELEDLGIPHPWHPLNVNVLEKSAARKLLARSAAQEKLPTLTDVEKDDIIHLVTSNPMCLKLAVRLLRNEGIEKFRETRIQFLARLRMEKIQGLLYGRILNHIKEQDVRQVAYPGLVVRRITPAVIREVLAGPCKLTLTVKRDENAIFDDMRKEVALMIYNEKDESLRHRPDVRRAMLLDLTDHVMKEIISEIDRAAVKYYKDFDDGASRAEEIYHRLRLGESEDILDARWVPEAKGFLKDAGEELPASQRIWLANKLDVAINESIRREANQEAWEAQAARLAENYLSSADAESALKILEERDDRLPRSHLYDLHTEAYRILGSPDLAINKGREGVDALINAGDVGQALDLLLKMVVIEESRSNLAAADSLLYETENVARQTSDQMKKLRTRVSRLRLERKLRPEAEARLADLRRAALGKLDDDDILFALSQRPVLLRETAAELAAYGPEIAELAIDILGLETSTIDQARALGQVISTLYQETDPAKTSDPDDAIFLQEWQSTGHNPAVVEEWVSAKGRKLTSRLAQKASRSAPESDLLHDLQNYFRAGENILLADVGKTFQATGRTGEARKIYEQTLETMRRAGDREGEASTLSNLAEIRRMENDPDEALALLEKAVEIWRDLGNQGEEARALYDYAALLLVLRRYEEARDPFNKALAIFRERGDDNRVAMTLHNLGILYSEMAEMDKSLGYFDEVSAIYHKLGERSQEAGALNVTGEILRENGRLQQARQVYNKALTLWREVGDRGAEVDTLIELAGVAEAEEEIDQALRHFEKALEIVRILGNRERETWMLDEMSRLNRKIGNVQAGENLERESERLVGEKESFKETVSGRGEAELDVRQLYKRIADQFNLEELRELTFTLNIEFEDLGGTTKSAIARELVQYMDRRGRLNELDQVIRQLRD